MWQCPNCRKQIEDSVNVCLDCAPKKPQDINVVSISEGMNNKHVDNFICPNCKSGNVQKLSLLVDSGTRQLSATTIGGSIGTGGKELGIGITGGTLKSELASKLGPPVKPIMNRKNIETYRVFIFPLFIISPLGISIAALLTEQYGGGLTILFITALLVYYIYFELIPKWESNLKPQNDEYNKKLIKYNNSFCCLRCGEVFEVY